MLAKEGYYCSTLSRDYNNNVPEGGIGYTNSEDECARKCLKKKDTTEMFAYGRHGYGRQLRQCKNNGQCKCYCLPTGEPTRVKDHLCVNMKKDRKFATYALEGNEIN